MDGQELQLDIPVQLIQGRTLIPLRAVTEALGKKVFWDDKGLIMISNEDLAMDDHTVDQILYLFK